MKRRILRGFLLGSVASAMVDQEVEPKTMDIRQANKRVIEQLIQRVWREGHLDELPEFWAADCINHADAAAEKRGLAAVRSYHEGFAQWFRDYENIEIETQQQIAESDRVVTQMLLRAVHREKHRNISLATIRIDRITSRKIAEHWSVADMAGLMRQLA